MSTHRGRRGAAPAACRARDRAGLPAAALAALLLAGTAAAPAGAVTHTTGNPAGRKPVGGWQLGSRGVIVNYPAHGARRLPHVAASAWVVADAGTGQVLAARDPHGWYRPASTLKVLTAVTLMPALNPAATVVASHRAAAAVPSKVGLIQGDSYRVSDLFRALLMISANDAAVALAQATGSYARGVAMMNAEARHLQADDTHAVHPNGLEAKDQHVSAYDEALFARRGLRIPAFMADEKLWVSTFPRRPHHRPVKLWNQNTMLQTYRGDLGGKIGWTPLAKTTFIGWARRGGHTLVVTILHCRPLAEMTYAARLLNWGFATDGKVRPVGVLVRPVGDPVRPLPGVATAAHQHPAATAGTAVRRPHAATRPANVNLPGVSLAVALATVAIAVLTGAGTARAARRGRRPAARR